jgi:hypothetical protein
MPNVPTLPTCSIVASQYRTRITSKCNPTQYTKNAFREYRFVSTARVRLYTIFSNGFKLRYTRADSYTVSP